ncbi:porin family protein [Mucilaginibacter gotjawali]|uniref:porin family protein n=1 Tax=Mucilaginibacter gotjawali TaxID=1550579 RepID=UPI000BBA523F|nr:porin family protein [Mucilaginibacter gotjawali]
MKKILLSTAFLVTVCISAKAQFSLGIKGGVNFSSISANDVSSSTVTGYQAGAFARIGKSWYLQPELYVNGTGGQFSSASGTGKVTFTNINFPLLLGKSFGTTDLNFRLLAGPVLVGVMSKNESFSDGFNATFKDFSFYKPHNYGYQVGAGVDFGSITADLRYQGVLIK